MAGRKAQSTSVVHALGDVVIARHVRWPSETIKFPYVSDVRLGNASSAKVVMAHSPALDAAGLLQPGTRLLLTKNESHCKTPYAMQLLADEGELVLCNPLRANQIARKLIDMQLIPALRMYKVGRAEVTRGDSRFDFQLMHRKTNQELLVEVKHVSTVDIAVDDPPPLRKAHFVLRGKGSRAKKTYARTALFPVDRAQQTYKGEKVVSERAIKHVVGLRKLQEKGVDCCIIFLVCRGDAESFRPCEESCPAFARELRLSHQAGVKVLAPQVGWGWKGTASFKRMLPVKIGRSTAKRKATQLQQRGTKKKARRLCT